MIKISVNYCRKDGRANYGSEGASCSIEAELASGTGDDALRAAAKGLYKTARQLVEDELNRHPAATPAASTPQRSDPPRNDNANRYPGPRNEAPRDGRQLLGWLRKQSNQSELMSRAREIAKREHLPTRFLDLDEEQTLVMFNELADWQPANGRH
jgi:hypothetical protein